MQETRATVQAKQLQLHRKKLIVAALCLGLVAGATWSVVHAGEALSGKAVVDQVRVTSQVG